MDVILLDKLFSQSHFKSVLDLPVLHILRFALRFNVGTQPGKATTCKTLQFLRLAGSRIRIKVVRGLPDMRLQLVKMFETNVLHSSL